MLNFLKTGIKLLPHVVNIGISIYDYFKNKKKEEGGERNKIDNALNEKLNELNRQKAMYRERNYQCNEKIERLERLLEENQQLLEEARRKDIERERRLLLKEQEKQREKMRKIEEEKIEIEKCKESLANEYNQSIFEIVEKFYKEQENWLNSLQGPEIEAKIGNLKEKLNILFDKLFDIEKVMEKINNKFLYIIKVTFKEIQLEKMNFMVIGTSGVGKSTLINEIFGEHLAEEGMGTRTTLDTKRYESKLVPFLSLLDTMGTEIGSGHKLSDVLKETLNEIMKKLNNINPNDHIHCILYCTTSNRFFKDELEVILKLREKYDGKKLPIVIVYTRGTKEKEVESIKQSINAFLKEHGESLSDDIFGITFIKVNAREEEIEGIGNLSMYPRFGLSNLMKICFKKGESSYIFAIKNSLIQIGQKSIQEYMDNITSQMLKNYDYINYLSLQFDPNFTDYIAYCFEKITDIYEQKGIKNEELNKLNDYMDLHHLAQGKDFDVIHCMVCNNIPKNPYKCRICESEVCENCYLAEENFLCKNCDGGEFDKAGIKYDQETEKTEKEDKINLNETESQKYSYSYKNKINEGKTLSKSYCMICQENPNIPYKCKSCEYKVCELCYLKELEKEENNYEYTCENCGQNEFEKIEDEVEMKNEIIYDAKKDDNYKNENDKELDLNQNYMNNSDDFKNYLETLEKNEGKKLSKILCMRCNNPPTEPLKCTNCGYKICNMCYLNLLGSQGTYLCENCDSAEFGPDSNNYEEQEEKNNQIKNDNYSGIINNNLKTESINAINRFRDEFKEELMEIFNPKFDQFAKEAANDIYIKVAEKYFDIGSNKNIQMKKKDELSAEAIEELNKSLKEKAQENFLSKFASQLFQDIILIFKKKCEEKLKIFINNLLNNKQANEFFKDCDALNENKKLKFEDELKKYIQNLENKETDSLKRAFSASDQSLGESGSSGCGGCNLSESQGCS